MDRARGNGATQLWHCQGLLAPGEHTAGVRVTLSGLRHMQLLAGVSKLSSGGRGPVAYSGCSAKSMRTMRIFTSPSQQRARKRCSPVTAGSSMS